MPNIKSAIKKNKQDQVKKATNRVYEKKIEDIMSNMKKMDKGAKLEKMVPEAYSVIDKAAKKGVIHDNKASRLKAKVSRLNAKS